MIPEIGHYALVLALFLALIQATVPIYGARSNDSVLMGVAGPTALGQFLFVAMAFAALIACYVQSDFSVITVFENSHSAMPLIYKITSAWGNHEGSMLLWVFILTLFGALVALFGGNLPATLRANVLGVQSWIAVAFVLFILLTSNPFLRMEQAPLEGRDLNPLLQDLGLAIHPPLLYLGYVGFSISFSFAIAALIDGHIDAAWARWVRPWALLAWMFLTLGIAMGSYWAYYTLGWGGWWFWDPVENASLMPWLAGTALLHSALVMEKRDALKVWTILLAILAFSLSLVGTFLVRSGVLTSVHAFASDPMRGIFILAILVLFIGGGLTLFAWRAPLLKQGGLFAPVSREGALVLNNLFLVIACGTVFVGTLYPLALEALTGAKISVGAPYFNWTFGLLFIPLMLAMPFGPLMAWKRGDLLGVAQRLVGAAAVAAVGVAVTFAVEGGGPVLVPFAMGLALFVIAGAVTDLIERTGLLKVPARTALARARGLPRSAWGTTFAHLGLGITLLGIIGETQWSAERIAEVKPGQTISVRRYDFHFDGTTTRQGPNYHELAAHFTVHHGGDFVGVMEPSKRTFPSRGSETNEASLLSRGFAQLYLSLGEVSPDGSVAVRLYYKPLVLLIWLGAVVMVVGGSLSLSDRRLRVGAPKPARSRPAMQPAGIAAMKRVMTSLQRLSFALALVVSLPIAQGVFVPGLIVPGFIVPALAVQPDEMLSDPVLEARARGLSKELRCMVCQNQSIDDSEAPLARDLRILVRERLTAGDSDAQVLDFLVARYGEFVLLKPRFNWHTALLWLLPPGALAGGAMVLLLVARRRRTALPAPGAGAGLTAAEEARLERLLQSGDR